MPRNPEVVAKRPPPLGLSTLALSILLSGPALSCGAAVRAAPSPDRAGAGAAPQHLSVEQACASRYDAAVIASREAAAQHERAMQEREVAIAAGKEAAAARKDARLRSEAALQRWVINHVAINKLPCVLADADYVMGVRVTNRGQAPLDCELEELRAGASAPSPLLHQVVAPQQTARLEVPVRTCRADARSSRYSLSCALSDANRAEAGIEDPRVRSFAYDADALVLSSDAPPVEPFVEPPAPAPPPPAPERAAFLAACRSGDER